MNRGVIVIRNEERMGFLINKEYGEFSDLFV